MVELSGHFVEWAAWEVESELTLLGDAVPPMLSEEEVEESSLRSKSFFFGGLCGVSRPMVRVGGGRMWDAGWLGGGWLALMLEVGRFPGMGGGRWGGS